MPVSCSDPSEVTCARCGATSTAEVWLIIHGGERPDLLDAARRGTLSRHLCMRCGSLIEIDAPLLVFCPGQRLPLVFCPSEGGSPEENQEVALALLGQLEERLGSVLPEELVEQFATSPRFALAEVLGPGAPPGPTPGEAGLTPALRQTAGKLLGAQTWVEVRAVLEAHPELICQQVVALFAACHQRALERREGPVARVSDQLCLLLNRCMVLGVQGAWLEWMLSKAVEVAIEDLAPEVRMALMLVGALGLDLSSEEDRARLQRECSSLADVLDRAHSLSTSPGPELQPLFHEAEEAERRATTEHGPAALHGAVDAWERLLASPVLRAASPYLQLKAQDGASAALLRRSQILGAVPDLQRAIMLLQDALSWTPPDSPSRLWRLNNLGVALRNRYGCLGAREDLEDATRIARMTSLLVEEGSPHRPGYLNNLGNSLLTLYKLSDRPEDLDEAVGVFREAVELFPDDSPELPAVLTNLGLALEDRHERTGELGDLEEAVDRCAQAVVATPSDAPELASRLHNHALSLAQRHAVLGRREDLDLSITLSLRALSLTPMQSQQRASRLDGLGARLLYRYEGTGHSEDLDQAIQSFELAVGLTDESAPTMPLWLSNLGMALRLRYERTGRLGHLDAAITTCRRGLVLAATQPAAWRLLASNLGSCLQQWYVRTAESAALEQAISLLEEVVADESAGPTARAAGLTNLSTCLIHLYRKTRARALLDRAILALESACTLVSAGAPDLGVIQNNLADGLLLRHRLRGEVVDLEAATHAAMSAVDATPAAAPMLPIFLVNLGACWREQHARSKSSAHLADATSAFERACALGLERNPSVTLQASRGWCKMALQQRDWAQAARAAGYGLEAADRLHAIQLRRADRESWLRDTHRLPALAAYAQARLGNLREAALTLERGRARLLTDAMDRDRAELQALALSHPEAVRHFRDAASRLWHLERMAIPRVGDPASSPSWARDQVRAAQGALDEAIAAIRRLPGQEDFLGAPTWRDLECALEEGVPVVYIVSVSVGGLVLILLKRGGHVRIVGHWANALTEDRLHELFLGAGVDSRDGWFRVYLETQSRPRAHADDAATAKAQDEAASARRGRWHETILQTTRALWDLVMGAVVERLEALDVEEAVLLPGGMLGLLPLHAAWTTTPTLRFALDRIAFSLAPSLRALAHARRLAHPVEPAGLRVLAVCDPQPIGTGGSRSAGPGDQPNALPFSKLEVQAITAHFEHPVRLMGAQATRGGVLSGLPAAQVAHFSCHGGMDWWDPQQSGLLMAHDELLTVQDLFHQHLPGARLAVLSACETGVPGFELPDEVVALPAAFMRAGFAGVVASLWSVSDLATALLIARFYELWLHDRLRPAVALQRAQLWIRDTTVSEMEAHFEQQIPAFVGLRRPASAAEVILPTLTVMARKAMTNTSVFAHPFWWAAFTFTGA